MGLERSQAIHILEKTQGKPSIYLIFSLTNELLKSSFLIVKINEIIEAVLAEHLLSPGFLCTL